MKYLFFCCVGSLLIISCSSNTNKNAGTDIVIAGDTLAKAKSTARNDNTATIRSLCFLRTDGKKNQDSTSIELVIKGSKVTGTMNWLPYQKDSRKGRLAGIAQGDTINAVWSFMQEGMKDTLNLKFTLKNETLAQKPLKLNTKTGREQTDASAPYSLKFNSSTKVHH